MDLYQKETIYGSKALWYSPSLRRIFDEKLVPDCIHFASILEFQVYKELVKFFGADKIKCHYREILIPKEKGVNKAITWDVDFYIPEFEYYVEAKGIETEVYKLKRELFRWKYQNKKTLFVCKSVDDVLAVIVAAKLKTRYPHSAGGA